MNFGVTYWSFGATYLNFDTLYLNFGVISLNFGTAIENRVFFKCVGEGCLGLPGHPGGLGIGVGKKYSAYPLHGFPGEKKERLGLSFNVPCPCCVPTLVFCQHTEWPWRSLWDIIISEMEMGVYFPRVIFRCFSLNPTMGWPLALLLLCLVTAGHATWQT